MRIPPLYKSKYWQLFFGGAAVGGILSWMIFLYIYGVFSEEQRTLILTQQAEIEKLKKANHLLIEDKNKLNEENKRILTVQDIKVEITNHEQYDLDSLTVHSLVAEIRSDLQHLLTKNIQSVAQNRELLRKAIENKVYERNETKYKYKVETIYFDTVIDISVKIIRE
ncbi:MAG: sporulation membrane protein YtrI [Ectobacillus sp.]